ncbi:MAG: DMT family transporter [Pseudomonadota bacterium]
MRHDKVISWVLLIAAGSIWGMTFSLAKFATAGGMHPIGLNFWQSLLGFIFLRLYLAFRGDQLPLTSNHLVFYAICGLLGTALPGTLLFFAAASLPAGVLSIVIAVVPILTTAIAFAIGIEQAASSRFLGILLGAIAVVVIVAPDDSLPNSGSTFWVLIAVIAAFCYALESLYIALRMPPGSGALTVLCGMFLTGSLMTGIVALATGHLLPPVISFTMVEGAIVAMAAINALAYGAFIYLVTSAGPVFASQMGYLVTVSGVAWGIVMFGEQHSRWIWTAMLIMVAGLALVQPRKEAKNH